MSDQALGSPASAPNGARLQARKAAGRLSAWPPHCQSPDTAATTSLHLPRSRRNARQRSGRSARSQLPQQHAYADRVSKLVPFGLAPFSSPNLESYSRLVVNHLRFNQQKTRSKAPMPARHVLRRSTKAPVTWNARSQARGKVARRPPKAGEADTDAKPSPSLRTSAPRFKPRPTKSERAASGCRTDWSIEI